MPMIDLYHPENAFTPQAQAALVEELTALLLEMEGAPDNPVSRTISWMFLHPLPPQSFNIGGKTAPVPIYKVVFSVPQGTVKLHGPRTLPQRDALVKRATTAILKAEGAADDAANQARVWVFLHEVPEGTWGGQGRLVGIQDISNFVTNATPVAPREAVTA